MKTFYYVLYFSNFYPYLVILFSEIQGWFLTQLVIILYINSFNQFPVLVQQAVLFFGFRLVID